ncbi:MAG: respiratory nitrate reductase subunit gamma [Acidobacteriota bacterium]|nr:respiratory nitrate reductase subunit gamma [Acidobacteriota bacterium]
MNYLNPLLFGVLPYVAFFAFFLMTIMRYRLRTFSYSSLSSQFLENRLHFWAVVPFHYGILTVLAGHIAAWLLPGRILAWNSNPARLLALEVTGFAFGLLTLVGTAAAAIRRFTVPSVRSVTSTADWIVYGLLSIQVVSGLIVALHYPWGSSWYASVVAPYFWSVAKLNPQIDSIAAMPLLVKIHVVNAYLTIGYFPFTRLVHVLVVPNPYLWRKTQVTRWYAHEEKTA